MHVLQCDIVEFPLTSLTYIPVSGIFPSKGSTVSYGELDFHVTKGRNFYPIFYICGVAQESTINSPLSYLLVFHFMIDISLLKKPKLLWVFSMISFP